MDLQSGRGVRDVQPLIPWEIRKPGKLNRHPSKAMSLKDASSITQTEFTYCKTLLPSKDQLFKHMSLKWIFPVQTTAEAAQRPISSSEPFHWSKNTEKLHQILYVICFCVSFVRQCLTVYLWLLHNSLYKSASTILVAIHCVLPSYGFKGR